MSSLKQSVEGIRPRQDRRPDVLVISSELPWPLNTGGHLRTFHLLKALTATCQVRLVTVVESADDPGIGILEQYGMRVHAAVSGPRNRLTEATRAARALLRREPYVLFHRHNRWPLRQVIRQELSSATPDILYLDHLDPLAFRSVFPGVPVIADLHNVYSRLTARVAEERRWPLNTYLRREARLLADMEQQVAATADALLTVSAQERDEFLARGARCVHLIPNGVDCSAYDRFPVGRRNPEPVLLYLGALSWEPNARAAAFLAGQIMPQIRREHPGARLLLVGRQPGSEVRALAELPGVEVHADVPDIGVYLQQASLLAVPLDSGGGTRLKILEAFAAGLPVVSTPVGCEGIDCRHAEHLWVAERDQFAAALLDALATPELACEFAERGRRLAQDHYDWSVIGRHACDAVIAAAARHSPRNAGAAS